MTNAVLTGDKVTKEPKDAFKPDDADIYATFDLDNPKDGEKLRGVLICDKSAVAPPNTKVVETTLVLKANQTSGDFHFSKPTKGWPEGDYHAEIYDGENKVESLPFKVSKGSP